MGDCVEDQGSQISSVGLHHSATHIYFGGFARYYQVHKLLKIWHPQVFGPDNDSK